MKRLILSTVILGVMLSAGGQAVAQELKLRMAVIRVPPTGYGEAMSEVPKRIEEATGGQVTVEIFDSLIPGDQLASALRDGRIDMIGGVHPYLTAEEPRFGIGHLPGLIRDAVEYKFVLDAYMEDLINEAWNDRYNGTALAHGLWYESPHFSTEPLDELSDFEGKKVRSHNAEAAQVLAAVGAEPTRIDFSEVGPALQRGVIDAVSTEYGTALLLGLSDVTSYMQNWDFSVNMGWAVVINNDVWAKLPDEFKEPVRTALAEMQEEHFANYHAKNLAKRQELVEQGITYVEITDEQNQAVFTDEVTSAIYEDWYERSEDVGFDGRAIVDRVRVILGRQ